MTGARDLDPRTVRLQAAVSALEREILPHNHRGRTSDDPSDDYLTGWNEALREVLRLLDRDDQAMRNVIAAATSKALDKRRAAGKKLGGEVPYGFRLGRDGQTLLELASEQKVIAAAYRLRSRGLSFRMIAAMLAVDGHRNRSRKRFDPKQIQRMLHDGALGETPDVTEQATS